MSVSYSKKCERAAWSIRALQDRARKILSEEYPLNSNVRVVHSRGSFYGVVVGYCHDPSYMIVVNERSGKRSNRWYREVELC